MSETQHSTGRISWKRGQVLTCENPDCSVTFYRTKSQIARAASSCCSHACFRKLRRLRTAQRTTKRCGKCHEELPVEAFSRYESGRKQGLPVGYCKECSKQAQVTYYAQNAERIKQHARDKWNEIPAEQQRLQKLVWRQANPVKAKAISDRWRAHKYEAPINDFTADQWKEMQAAYQHRCVYCNKRCKGKLTQDHITPLSKGGNHTAANIVPACKSCNSKKHIHGPLQQIQPLLVTVAPAVPKKRIKKNSTEDIMMLKSVSDRSNHQSSQ